MTYSNPKRKFSSKKKNVQKHKSLTSGFHRAHMIRQARISRHKPTCVRLGGGQEPIG